VGEREYWDPARAIAHRWIEALNTGELRLLDESAWWQISAKH
jgi:hypothetical protein